MPRFRLQMAPDRDRDDVTTRKQSRRAIAALALAVLLTPLTSRADDKADTIVVSERDCRYLARYVDSGDATYKPGVDVHGRKVAPADLNAEKDYWRNQKIGLDLVFRLGDLRPDLARRLIGRAEVNAGRIEVDLKTGRAQLNGIDLDDPAMRELAVMCRARLEKTEKKD